MYFEEVTVEDKKLCYLTPTPFCFGCLNLNTNRKLAVLGENTIIFCILFNEYSAQASDILLCWECTAVLRKVKLFKEKVDHAQTLLSEKLATEINELPKGLSNLKNSNIETTNYASANPDLYLIKCDDDVEIIQTEIKEETPDEYFDQNFEYEDDGPNNNFDYETNDFEGTKNTEKNVIKQDIKQNEPRKLRLTAEKRVLYGADFKDRKKISAPKRKRKKNLKSELQVEFENEETPVQKLEDPDFKCSKFVMNMYKSKPQSYKIKKDSANNKKQKSKPPYKAVSNKVGYTEIPLSVEEVDSWMEKERKSEYFTTPSKTEYKCELCLKIFANEKRAIKIHKLYHRESKERLLQCQYCKYGVRKGLSGAKCLQNHIQKYHGHILQCNTCEFKCYSESYMEMHIKKHKTSMQCQHCMGRFGTKDEFYAHFCVCDECGNRYRTKHRLQRHILKDHMKQSHNWLEEEAYCVPCHRQFTELKAYRAHLAINYAHAHERSTEPERKVMKKKKHYPCTSCDRMFLSSKGLKDHNNREHLNLPFGQDPSKEYGCYRCEKKFRKVNSLHRHVKFHHDAIREHACDYCDQRFFTKQILENHIRTHTGERPFHCEHCDAKFAQKVAMRQHVKFIHMKERREVATSSYQGPSYE